MDFATNAPLQVSLIEFLEAPAWVLHNICSFNFFQVLHDLTGQLSGRRGIGLSVVGGYCRHLLRQPQTIFALKV